MQTQFPISCGRRAAGAARFLAVLASPVIVSIAYGQPGSSLEQFWSRAELHSGTTGSVVQSVALSGRVQFDQVKVESGGADFSDFDLRRLRFGIRTEFARGLSFHTEADFDPNGGNLRYQRLTDTYIAWSPGDAFVLTVGKQGAAFTMDGQTSSKQLLTIDRSNLSNNMWFPEEYIPGITVSGEKAGFVYDLGVFSSGAKNRGFGDSDGGEFVLATIGRDLSGRLAANKALLRLNVVDNEPDPQNGFTRSLEKVLSINFDFAQDRWGIRSDLSSARGYLGQSDLIGFMVMPFVDLGNQLQLVTRYTYIESDEVNGVRFARYERELAAGRGDEYSEIYVGANYFWHGHKLKLQSGIAYVDMEDRAADGGTYTGWAWTTGFRVSW